MLRILTGTLLEVAHRRLSSEDVQEILQKKDRRLNKKTLPAYPLFFLNANYTDYKTPKELISMYSILTI